MIVQFWVYFIANHIGFIHDVTGDVEKGNQSRIPTFDLNKWVMLSFKLVEEWEREWVQ